MRTTLKFVMDHCGKPGVGVVCTIYLSEDQVLNGPRDDCTLAWEIGGREELRFEMSPRELFTMATAIVRALAPRSP